MTKEIKKALKEKGYASKDISIRKKYGGYSVAYYVKIKTPYIDKDAISKIVRKFESFEMCQASGEILMGGNTYIFVSYENSKVEELSRLFKKLPYEKIVVVVDQGGDEYNYNTDCLESVKRKYTKRELEEKEFRVYGKREYFDALINDYGFKFEDLRDCVNAFYII